MNMIRCSRCGDDKPQSAYPKNASKRLGVDLECLRCKRARENSPGARAAKRERFLKQKYGITGEQYEALVQQHMGVCGICRRPETKTNSYGELVPLAVDHDHNTNRVRGLLCSCCNKAIGLLGDNARGLLAALDYLLRGAA